MSFIAQQPNGLYCRYSSIVECITHYNMTKEDYINMRGQEEAEDVLKNYIQPFERVKEDFMTYNMTVDEFKQILKEMGDDKWDKFVYESEVEEE